MGQDLVPGHGRPLGDRRARFTNRAGAQPRGPNSLGPRLKALLSALTTALGFGNRPLIIRAVKVIVLLAIMQAILGAGLWWLSEEWLTPKMATGVERIADLYAAAAGRFMLATDQTALDLLVRQGATSPQIVYVGVEDAHGTVLAHTDPARVGKIWNEAMTTRIRSTAGTPPREIAVLILNPDQKAGPPVGRVRVGYITIDDGRTIVPSTHARGSVVPFLVITVVAAIPLGWLLIVLTKPSVRRPSETPGPSLEALAQVAWAHHGQFVTEVRRLTVALAERDAQVARLTKTVEHAAQSNSIDPSHQRAILSVTHAVRTSLSNILGFSKLLLRELDGTLTETQTADVMNIQRAGTELLTFVTALSELNRAEGRQVQIQPEAVDVKALLNELAAEYGSAHSLEIKVECPAELPMVRMDRTHLGQILRTLTMQATTLSGHGEIALMTRSNGKTVHISVAYPGRVISDEDMATMFVSKETSGGRIGLTLARSLAILNRGDIDVENQSGNGVVFTLTMPIEDAHAG
jgi:signal transduction histidine kinase